MDLLLKNATVVNEGQTFRGSVVVRGERISQVLRQKDFASVKLYNEAVRNAASLAETMDLEGLHVFPGMIDTHVHFREPGDGWAGNIESESKAAVLGGVTSFMDMPNNIPPATSNALLEDKFASAEQTSYANYSFYLGATGNNLDQIRSIRKKQVCGVKVFMGSSTGNLLVDRAEDMEDIFRYCRVPIAVHAEDNAVIASNLSAAIQRFSGSIPPQMHPKIRSRSACLKSSGLAVELALKHCARLHILHITTKEEVQMLSQVQNSGLITAETCPSYLWFCSKDYRRYGNLIKCNPAIKDVEDMLELRKALKNGILQTVGSDHAPHLLKDKLKPYNQCPSGIPLIQYEMQMMLALAKEGVFALADIAEKTSHNPARCFAIKDRGFIREGQYADLAIADLSRPASTDSPAAMCRWSPFSEEGICIRGKDGKAKRKNGFPCSIVHTMVNGCFVVRNGLLTGKRRSRRLMFDR